MILFCMDKHIQLLMFLPAFMLPSSKENLTLLAPLHPYGTSIQKFLRSFHISISELFPFSSYYFIYVLEFNIVVLTHLPILLFLYGQIPIEIQKLPASFNDVRSIEEQINENIKTIKEILCMDPHHHKFERFTCRASITDYDLHRGWWYQSCLECTKSLSDKGSVFGCIEHNEVTPVPWFRVNNVVTDANGGATFMMAGKM